MCGEDGYPPGATKIDFELVDNKWNPEQGEQLGKERHSDQGKGEDVEKEKESKAPLSLIEFLIYLSHLPINLVKQKGGH